MSIIPSGVVLFLLQLLIEAGVGSMGKGEGTPRAEVERKCRQTVGIVI